VTHCPLHMHPALSPCLEKVHTSRREFAQLSKDANISQLDTTTEDSTDGLTDC
jgi:hypothetical protein